MTSPTEDSVEQGVSEYLAGMSNEFEKITAPDGLFPLAEEEVQHWGTIQRYRCWQKGPNSVVHFTLPELYNDCFTRYADKEFIIYEGERLKFCDIIQSAVAFARSVKHEYEFPRGTCIAIAGRNYPEWVIAFLAVTGFLSSVALPVNSWWTDDELRYGLEDSESKLFIADPERMARAPFLEAIGVPAICMRAGGKTPPHGAKRFEDLVSAGRLLPALNSAPVAQDDNCMLMYTSGTTNKPKGVVMTHRNVMSAINLVRMWKSLGPESAPQRVGLLASPLFHVNGTHVGLLQAIANGNKLVLMYKWDASNVLPLIERERIQGITGVPTNTYDLVNHPDFEKYDTSSMLDVGGGGAAFASPMIKKVKDKFKHANAGTGYGLTETNAITVVMPAELFPARPTSCGFPVLYVDVCILGDNNEKLPPGESGEICLRGATIMKEYWKKPDKTQEVFHMDAEGRLWFRSGDIGTMDAQNFVYILDRAKDIIIRGGENISCAEVEAALFEHPSVAEVAAIGIPHATLGETVGVAVAFKVGVPVASSEELKAYAAQRLAAFKVPSDFFVWDGSLPRGATGKVQKREIRDEVAKMLKEKTGPTSKL